MTSLLDPWNDAVSTSVVDHLVLWKVKVPSWAVTVHCPRWLAPGYDEEVVPMVAELWVAVVASANLHGRCSGVRHLPRKPDFDGSVLGQ